MVSKNKRTKVRAARAALVLLAVVVLGGGSFALASGQGIGGGLVAAVLSSITGRPTIIITRSSSSPSGSIKSGVSQTLAVFDVSAKNVTHGAKLQNTAIRTTINATSPAPL